MGKVNKGLQWWSGLLCKLKIGFFFARDGVAYLMLAICSSSYELKLIQKATGEPVVLSKLSKSKIKPETRRSLELLRGL